MATARTWVPRGVALAAFLLYVVLAPGGPFWLDSGELSAAGFGLGSPHPTGFPLFCVGAKAASLLLPFGEIAFRIHLFSALCAAVAAFCVARLVIELARDDAAAVAGAAAAGLTLALSFGFLRQATVAEVYAPNAAMIAAALLLFARVVDQGRHRDGLLLALVLGLGAGLHITFALIVPPVLAYVIWRLHRGARWPLLVPVLGVTVAAGLYAYLPLRSATGRTAAVDWGHPRTASALIDHASAGRPRRAFATRTAHGSASMMRTTEPRVIAHNAGTFFGDAADQLGPLALIAMLGGLVWMFARKRRRQVGAALAVLIGGDAIYSIWINPMGLVDLQDGVPFAVGACVAAGVGVAWFARSLGRAAPYAGGVAAVLLAFPAAVHGLGPAREATTGDLPRAWAEAALVRAPPRAIALVQNDSTASTMIYLGVVEGARPDVAVLVRQHLTGDLERTRRVLAQSGVELPAEIAPGAVLPHLFGGPRPVLWEAGRGALPKGHALEPGVPLSKVVKAGGAVDFGPPVARLEALIASPGSGDRSARRVLAVALNALGRMAYGHGRLAVAAGLFDAAIAIRPAHVSARINRGTVAGRMGQYRAAAEQTERALAIDPNHVGALVNAARWRLRLDEDAVARRHLSRALAIDGEQITALSLMALIALREGAVSRARELLARAHRLDPMDPDLLDIRRQLEARQPKARD